jgi:hypothetical protein
MRETHPARATSTYNATGTADRCQPAPGRPENKHRARAPAKWTVDPKRR